MRHMREYQRVQLKRNDKGLRYITGGPFADALWDTAVVPDRLWHYTNGAGLIGIANNQCLWCTEYRFLNDQDEVAAFSEHLLRRLQDLFSTLWTNDEVDSIMGAFQLIATWNVFVGSFCMEGDRNDLWSQYATEAGYALGFDPNVLRSLARRQGFALAPVLYGDKNAVAFAESIVKDHEDVWRSFRSPLSQTNINKIHKYSCRLLLHFAPFFKPQSFERENEWRLVKVAGIDEAKSRFRPSKTFGVVEFVEFDFRIDEKGRPRRVGGVHPHLIPNVIVGPGNQTDGWAIQRIPYEVLRTNGFETLVSATNSSLRFAK